MKFVHPLILAGQTVLSRVRDHEAEGEDSGGQRKGLAWYDSILFFKCSLLPLNEVHRSPYSLVPGASP